MTGYEATSPGELLWYSIGRWLKANSPDGALLEWTGIPWIEPDGQLGQFFRSTVVSTVCVRIVSCARDVLATCLDHEREEPSAVFHDVVVDEVKQYCVDPLGMSFADRRLGWFAEHAFQSADAARGSVSDRARSETYRQAANAHGGSIKCYCCDTALGTPTIAGRIGGVALDHLWPRAFGGVSTEVNLLPICDPCNALKMDRISWDVFGVVQDYSMADNGPGGRALTKMALHRRAAVRLSERDGTTLKEAYLRLGPFGDLRTIHPDGGQWFFNRTAHDLCVLPGLW